MNNEDITHAMCSLLNGFKKKKIMNNPTNAISNELCKIVGPLWAQHCVQDPDVAG